jgi:hypothetical protein
MAANAEVMDRSEVPENLLANCHDSLPAPSKVATARLRFDSLEGGYA